MGERERILEVLSRSQLTGQQFDFLSGQWEAQKGMELANGTDRVKDWKIKAEKWIITKPQGFEFSADDLVYAIGVPDEGPNRNNVVGAWFNAKSKSRIITFTGRMKASSRISRHTGLCRVWVKN